MPLELSFQNKNINPVVVDNVGDAREASQEEAANTGGLSLPGILFKQGERYCISTAIPVRRSGHDCWMSVMPRSAVTSPTSWRRATDRL